MIMNRRYFLTVAAGAAVARSTGSGRSNAAEADPWSRSELMEPAVLAKALQGGESPLILCVGFPVLYRQKHITHARLAGPASKPEGAAALKQSVAAMPKNTKIVIYCGCCPMRDCPNLRPGFSLLKSLGYAAVHVLNLPANFRTDWVDKGYPVESSLSGG
jgi:hypothetical protein